MISKFSVKKPLTVFVSVLMVIILGFVSFSSMIPDLLPNINLPYAVVVTAYVGATPEEVEQTVTRPLEQSMASLENINFISSTSSESVSQIMLEFTDSANMDVVVPEIREKINAVSGEWPDTVATPFIIKINPNLLPVVISAANYEGKSNVELTEFVNEEILSELEGVTGVAGVELNGDVVERINVILSQEKIDNLNKRISDGLNEEFKEAEEEIADGEQEIEEGLDEVNSGISEMDDLRDTLEEGQGALVEEIPPAEAELLNERFKLESGITELKTQISTAEQSYATLATTLETLTGVSQQLADLYTQKDNLNAQITSLQNIKTNYPTKTARVKELNALIAPLEAEETAGTITPEDQQTLNDYRAELTQLNIDIATMEATLAANGVDVAAPDLDTAIDDKIAEYNGVISSLDTAINGVETVMQAMGIQDVDALNAQIAELSAQLGPLQEGIAQMNGILSQMQAGTVTMTEVQAQLNSEVLSGTFEITTGLAEIISGQSALESAKVELEAAQEQLNTAKEDLEEQRESAINSATVEITMEMVDQILFAQNFSMPAGYITENQEDYLIRVGDKVADLEELNNLALMNIDIDGVGTVYLKDVADVFLTDNSQLLYSKVNGENGLIISFSKQPTYATATVSENLNDKFEELSNEYEGLTFSNLLDQGDYINLVVNSVLQSLIMGAILSIIILFLFLRDFRPTLIIAFSIPISLLFAMVLMYFSGVSLNIISLSGLAIGVGMLVDNSVVVIENIYRYRMQGESSFKAAVKGATQVTGAIVASTLTTVMVFFPIVFIDGLTRELFTDMALTVGYSLGASLFVAITLVPAMASTMLRKEKERKDTLLNKLIDIYVVAVKKALKHKTAVLLISLGLLAGSAVLIIGRGYIFMPTMSSTELTVNIPLTPNSPFSEDVELADEVYERLSEIPELETIGITLPSEEGGAVGSFMSMAMGGSDEITINCLMYDDSARTDLQVSADITRICEEMGLEPTVTGASSMTSMLSSSGVSVKIYSDNQDNLIEEARNISQLFTTIDGLVDINSGVEDTKPEIRITVDKEKAVEHGLLTAQIFAEVAEKITTESNSTEITIENYDKDIILYSEENQGMTLDKLENMVIKYQDMQGENKEVELKEIAEIIPAHSLSSVNRENQRRVITVSATVAETHNVTLVTDEITDMLEDYENLPGSTIVVGGESDDIMEALEQLALMFLLAVVIIYFIMVAQFQSLKFPFIVMFTIPLATTGGFLALLLTGHEISVVAMVGFVMLSGIIVNNGIVLIDYINILRTGGMEKRDAIVQAGKTRMRPILMTALTTVLGLVFMAIGTGVGTEMMQPIAIVCIGGLLYATLMTLFVVPVIYDLLSNKDIKIIDVED